MIPTMLAIASPNFMGQKAREKSKITTNKCCLVFNVQMEEFWSESQDKKKKKDFYNFDTDDETSIEIIDAGAIKYFSSAKGLVVYASTQHLLKVQPLFSLGGNKMKQANQCTI